MKIFGTRFWGFSPEIHPFVGFTYEGSRDRLIKRSTAGDLVLILGTQSEPTAVEERGKLLGLVEFERTQAFAQDFIPEGEEIPARLLDEAGRFRWPYAVPALRAWRFEPPQGIIAAIGRQLTMAATTSIDELSYSEAELVLALSRVEVALAPSRAKERASRLAFHRGNKLDPTKSGQPGPPPSDWSALVSREDGPTATYLMRFGKRDIWKLGISKNPAQRRAALNFSVPFEILGEQWEVAFTHNWPSGAPAYAMEQALLKKLAKQCTTSERLRCDSALIEAAWAGYLAGSV